MDEFELIRRYFAGLAPSGPDVVRGIGADCALVRGRGDDDLAVSIDTLVEGVHFPAAAGAADVGWKALACGLSDLAATGAEPAWATLALTVPEAGAAWLAAFAGGFAGLARRHGVALVGGDTTRGPLAVTVQVAGHVPRGSALGRAGAAAGDAVYVSGWPGRAAAGLARLGAGTAAATDPLVAALLRPEPRVGLGQRLRGVASACIDVSDGLAADLGHIVAASGGGAELDAAALPVDPALAAAGDADRVQAWILGGGDDYELCFTVPPAREPDLATHADTGIPVTRIGTVTGGRGVALRAPDGSLRPAGGGYRHFDGG